MHESVYREVGKFAASLPGDPLLIADIGSMDVNGTYRPLFCKPKWTYTGFDISAGKNVDVVLDGHYEWKNVSTLFDVVISGSTLEHTKYPWLIMDQMARILKPGGRICVTAPYAWGYHAHPIDCWRIYPDGMRAIMERSGLFVDQVYMTADDHNKQCGDTIAVARKPRAGSADLDIFVVAYHARAALAETLQSIALWTSPGYRLTVYDNSAKNFPLTWLWNRFIEQSERKFVAILNADIVLSAEWASETLACMEAHANCGVASPVSNLDFHSAHLKGAFPRLFLASEGRAIADQMAGSSFPRFSLFREYQAAPGYCLVIRKETWKAVSGFDGRIPFAGNDYDFNRRVIQAGMSLGVCSRAACYHKWNQSINDGKALGTFDRKANCPKFSNPPNGATFSSI